MTRHWLVAVLVFAAGFSLQCERLVRSQVHLIPEGYIGPVAIVFDAEDGEAKLDEEKGALVFKVGQSGMLRVKGPPPPPGLVLMKYYYVAPDGSRREIPNRGEDTLFQVFRAEDGAMGAIRRLDFDGQVVHEEPAGHRWTSYIVGTPSSHPPAEWASMQSRLLDKALGRRPGAASR